MKLLQLAMYLFNAKPHAHFDAPIFVETDADWSAETPPTMRPRARPWGDPRLELPFSGPRMRPSLDRPVTWQFVEKVSHSQPPEAFWKVYKQPHPY